MTLMWSHWVCGKWPELTPCCFHLWMVDSGQAQAVCQWLLFLQIQGGDPTGTGTGRCHSEWRGPAGKHRASWGQGSLSDATMPESWLDELLMTLDSLSWALGVGGDELALQLDGCCSLGGPDSPSTFLELPVSKLR